jgi:putative flavoprotein involved in K+ transport
VNAPLTPAADAAASDDATSGASHDVVVVGAGPAGLAVAARLIRAGVEPVVLDAGPAAGHSWAAHYDRLRLNTVAWTSHLPGRRFPRRYGMYPTRDQVVAYLQGYVAGHLIQVSWKTVVGRIDPAPATASGPTAGRWIVRTSRGDVTARVVVVATGSCARPRIPEWPGLEDFPGDVLHSSGYREPSRWRGREVLVVGAGNSAGEIAADLIDGGASRVRVAVRTPPQLIPRRLLGIPTVYLAILTRRLPAVVGDTAVAVLRRLTIGDLSRYGVPTTRESLSRQYAERGVVPLSHPAFVPLVRAGRIDVVPAVERFSAEGVHLAGGQVVTADAVIAATGFDNGLAELVGHLGVLDDRGRPRATGGAALPGADGVFVTGFTDPLSGNLREIRLDARRIARGIHRRLRVDAGSTASLQGAPAARMRTERGR